MDKEAEFLKYLTENISTESQKDKFIRLINRDADKITESIRETIINKKDLWNRSYNHNPVFTKDFFRNFISDHIYKYTTHLWDTERNGLENYEKFILEINSDKILDELYLTNRKTYNLINNFLGKPKDDKEEYFWNYFNEKIYIGWQKPKEVWSHFLNYKPKDTFENEELNKILNNWSSINNKNKNLNFEKVIDYFRKTIRIDCDSKNSFKDIINRAIKEVDVNNDLNIIFNNIDFIDYCYLNISNLYKLLELIFKEIKEFIDVGKKEVEINIINNRELKCAEIHIKHINSLPKKVLSIDRVNDYFTGDSHKKYNYIFSNFDYEIASDFRIDSNEYRIPYSIGLFIKNETKCMLNKSGDVDKITTEIKTNKLNEKVDGYLHKIKIYY